MLCAHMDNPQNEKKKKSLELTLITMGSIIVNGSQARVILTLSPTPGNIRQHLETFLVSCISKVMAMNAAKYPMVCRSTYHN